MPNGAKPDASLRMHVLASGSKGNATIIDDSNSGKALLVDCGICKRDFFARCEEVGVELAHIGGILITHEHTDHIKGLGVVMRGLAKRGLRPTIYASAAVIAARNEINSLRNLCDVKLFQHNSPFKVAGIEVLAFPTSHDAAESFGFRFTQNGTMNDAIGYMTDSGEVTQEAFEALRGCRILALECNHDKRMLETGPYPYVVKQRVASKIGHLSNTQAAAALESLLSNTLEHIVAMHISENNNTYRLPVKTLEDVIFQNTHHAHVCAAYQYRAVSIC